MSPGVTPSLRGVVPQDIHPTFSIHFSSPGTIASGLKVEEMRVEGVNYGLYKAVRAITSSQIDFRS